MKNKNIPDNIPPKARAELEKLLDGNRNFINGTPTTQNMTVETLRLMSDYQEPYAVVLTCSDSRVIPEIIFDCGIGELFVTRVAGITAGPNIIETVEYAIMNLHVPLVIILGHDDCGVMKYASEQYPKAPEALKSIMKDVYPVFNGSNYKTHANVIAKEHTHYVEDVMIERSEVIRKAVENHTVYIANCHFNHTTGEVYLI